MVYMVILVYNKDNTESRKTIKESDVSESFNKDSTESKRTIKDSDLRNLLIIIRIVPKVEKQ